MLTPGPYFERVQFLGRPKSFILLLRKHFKVHFLRETRHSGFRGKPCHQNNYKQANKQAIFFQEDYSD